MAFLGSEKPHVLCLQETRADPDDAGRILPAFPYQHWFPAQRPGYSGTATFSCIEPLSVRRGIGVPEHDREGRVLTLELPQLFVVNVYTPNSRRDLSRLAVPREVGRSVPALPQAAGSRRKPVLFCGDINVAHEEIDLARPKENHHTHGFTDQERAGFSAILEAGFVDSFRELHPEGGNYTWWNLATRARERNVGWRIDYVVISESLRPELCEAFILPNVEGSDHCPVGVTLGRIAEALIVGAIRRSGGGTGSALPWRAR